jgi:hypothetical protein
MSPLDSVHRHFGRTYAAWSTPGEARLGDRPRACSPLVSCRCLYPRHLRSGRSRTPGLLTKMRIENEAIPATQSAFGNHQS